MVDLTVVNRVSIENPRSFGTRERGSFSFVLTGPPNLVCRHGLDVLGGRARGGGRRRGRRGVRRRDAAQVDRRRPTADERDAAAVGRRGRHLPVRAVRVAGRGALRGATRRPGPDADQRGPKFLPGARGRARQAAGTGSRPPARREQGLPRGRAGVAVRTGRVGPSPDAHVPPRHRHGVRGNADAPASRPEDGPPRTVRVQTRVAQTII